VAPASALAAADLDFKLRLLWLDTLVQNPDRRADNPNILLVGRALIPIDHAAALPFHHDWQLTERQPAQLEPAPHVFGALWQTLPAHAAGFASSVTRTQLEQAARSIPEPWLGPIVFDSVERQQLAYAAFLWKRLAALSALGDAC
jgi:hypothetical protein